MIVQIYVSTKDQSSVKSRIEQILANFHQPSRKITPSVETMIFQFTKADCSIGFMLGEVNADYDFRMKQLIRSATNPLIVLSNISLMEFGSCDFTFGYSKETIYMEHIADIPLLMVNQIYFPKQVITLESLAAQLELYSSLYDELLVRHSVLARYYPQPLFEAVLA